MDRYEHESSQRHHTFFILEQLPPAGLEAWKIELERRAVANAELAVHRIRQPPSIGCSRESSKTG